MLAGNLHWLRNFLTFYIWRRLFSEFYGVFLFLLKSVKENTPILKAFMKNSLFCIIIQSTCQSKPSEVSETQFNYCFQFQVETKVTFV